MTLFLHGPILTAAQTRLAEDAAIASGASIVALMERAGQAVADAVWRFGGGQEVLIICGPGNNGGDGYVAARMLLERGLDVRVGELGEPRSEAARAARGGWTGPVEPLDIVKPAPVLVDALFGTGLTRSLDAKIAADLQRLAGAARLVVAVDLPSGVDSDTGAALGAVIAHITVALVALKPAHLLYPAAGLCGQIRIETLGIKTKSDANILSRPGLPFPGPEDHKYTRGMVVVVSGAMPGAASLAASAAQRAGAGYVILTGEQGQAANAVVRKTLGEALGDDRIGAIVLGPGLGRSAEASDTLAKVIATGKPMVLDADALALLDPDALCAIGSRVILTPHEGEFNRLFGVISGSKIDRVRVAAKRSGSTIILKGPDTVIAAPGGNVTVARSASHWLASAGTGDILAGIAGAMLARGLSCEAAADAAVWLHSDAARRAGPALVADDLAHHLPAALADCG